MQQSLEETKRDVNEFFITNDEIPAQAETLNKIVSAPRFESITIKAIGSNIHKAVTLAENARSEKTLYLFSKISRIEDTEGSGFSVFEAHLNKANKKPGQDWF
jgi:hypothetical protein